MEPAYNDIMNYFVNNPVAIASAIISVCSISFILGTYTGKYLVKRLEKRKQSQLENTVQGDEK